MLSNFWPLTDYKLAGEDQPQCRLVILPDKQAMTLPFLTLLVTSIFPPDSSQEHSSQVIRTETIPWKLQLWQKQRQNAKPLTIAKDYMDE